MQVVQHAKLSTGEDPRWKTSWVPMSGRGTVWSMCEFHGLYFKEFVPETPDNVALVCLDEGPRMYTNLVGISYDRIEIDLRVVAVFEPVTDMVTLVKFRAAEEGSQL